MKLTPTQKLIHRIVDAKLPEPELEVMFALERFGRRWRADLCWRDDWLIVEVDGGVWTQGRHVRGKGYEEDCRKQAAAVLLGYRYLKVTPRHIETGEAVGWIKGCIYRRFQDERKRTAEPRRDRGRQDADGSHEHPGREQRPRSHRSR